MAAAIRQDVVYRTQQVLFQVVEIWLPFFDVGSIELEHLEAEVGFGVWMLLLDLAGCTADAFFAYLGNGGITGLAGFRVFWRRLGYLHHDELAITVVFGVELHYCVGGSGGAGKKIYYNILLRRNIRN